MNQLASSGPTSPQPMLITNAAPASMPFMSAGMVAPTPMMMNPRPMAMASTMASNPYGVAGVGAGMSGFANNPGVMPMMLGSPNGAGPNINAPFHSAFGK